MTTFELSPFAPVLLVWNSVFCCVAIWLVLTDRLLTWPLLARVGFALTLTGVLADVAFVFVLSRSDLFLYLLLKDFGFGLLVSSFLYTHVAQPRNRRRYPERDLDIED